MRPWNYFFDKLQSDVTWRDRLDIAWGLVIWLAWIWIFFILMRTFSGIYTPELGPWVRETFDWIILEKNK